MVYWSYERKYLSVDIASMPELNLGPEISEQPSVMDSAVEFRLHKFLSGYENFQNTALWEITRKCKKDC
jgi:hypothetical protein